MISTPFDTEHIEFSGMATGAGVPSTDMYSSDDDLHSSDDDDFRSSADTEFVSIFSRRSCCNSICSYVFEQAMRKYNEYHGGEFLMRNIHVSSANFAGCIFYRFIYRHSPEDTISRAPSHCYYPYIVNPDEDLNDPQFALFMRCLGFTNTVVFNSDRSSSAEDIHESVHQLYRDLHEIRTDLVNHSNLANHSEMASHTISTTPVSTIFTNYADLFGIACFAYAAYGLFSRGFAKNA